MATNSKLKSLLPKGMISSKFIPESFLSKLVTEGDGDAISILFPETRVKFSFSHKTAEFLKRYKYEWEIHYTKKGILLNMSKK